MMGIPVHSLLVLATAAAAVLSPGEWVIDNKESLLDGNRTTSAILTSTNEVPNTIGRPEHAMLILLCDGRNLGMRLYWPSYLGSGVLGSRWRVDDGPVERQFWEAMAGSSNIAVPTGGGRKLRNSLATGRRLVVQFSSYSSTAEAVFDISQGANALQTVETACSEKK